MLQTLRAKNRRITGVLLTAVAIVCPVLYSAVDRPVVRYARYELPRAVKRIAEHTTDGGDWILGIFAIIALISLFVFKNKKVYWQALFPLLSSGAASLIANILKPVCGRWRPKGYFSADGSYGFEPFSPISYVHASWPSGHSSSIMACMTAVAILYPRWRIPCFLIAALIGSTRIILTAHYPGDVFAGLALGYICAHWVYYYLVRYKKLPEPAGSRGP